MTKYTSSVPVTPGPSDFDRDEIVEEVKGLPDLNSKIAAFEKLPSEQEASVSAIFFELVGNKVIDDITPIYLGCQRDNRKNSSLKLFACVPCSSCYFTYYAIG